MSDSRLPKAKQELTIQQLMEGYIMPKDFNTDLLETQALSHDEEQRILQQTLQRGQKTAEPRRGIPRRKMWVFGLAAVMLLAMSSLAVAEIALKQDFFGFFNAESGQIPQQSGQEVNLQAGNEAGTLTVEQVLGDSKTVYVLLDFVGPEGVALDKDMYQWDKAYVSLSGSSGLGYYFENLPDDNPTDNHIRMMLCLNADSSLQGQQMDLELGDLKCYDPDAMDYTQAVGGDWKLSFKLDYTPSSQKINQDFDIMLGEATVHVNAIEVSPFTVILDLDVSNPEGYVAPEGYEEPEGGGVAILDDGTEVPYSYADSPVEVRLGDLLSDLDYFKITLQDGTVLDTYGGGGSSEPQHYEIIFEFNHILDLDEIASINYLGQELKLQ